MLTYRMIPEPIVFLVGLCLLIGVVTDIVPKVGLRLGMAIISAGLIAESLMSAL